MNTNSNSNDNGSSSNDNVTNDAPSNLSVGGTVPASPAVQFSHDAKAEAAAAEPAVTQAETGNAPLLVDGGVTQPITVATASNDVTFTVDGIVKGTTTVPLGTKVKEALKKIAEGVVATTLSIRDATGKAVGLDRVLNESMSVVSVAKAAGG
jgi:hypothetical protein